MTATALPSPYPVNLDITGRHVLVVGAGPVGARKVAGLNAAGAVVTVVSPQAVAEIVDASAAGHIRWHRREYQRGEVASYRLVITATNDTAVNAQVARDADAANVFVNSADDPENCTFILPAVVTRGDLQLTASTNGRSPAFAQWVRRQLEQQYTDLHARVLDLLSEVRLEARQQYGTSELPAWSAAIDTELFDLVAADRLGEARQRVRAALGLIEPAAITSEVVS